MTRPPGLIELRKLYEEWPYKTPMRVYQHRGPESSIGTDDEMGHVADVVDWAAEDVCAMLNAFPQLLELAQVAASAEKGWQATPEGNERFRDDVRDALRRLR